MRTNNNSNNAHTLPSPPQQQSVQQHTQQAQQQTSPTSTSSQPHQSASAQGSQQAGGPGGHYLRSTAHQFQVTAQHSLPSGPLNNSGPLKQQSQQSAVQQMVSSPSSTASSIAYGDDQGMGSDDSADDDVSPPRSRRSGGASSSSGSSSLQQSSGGSSSVKKEDPGSADEFDDETGPRNRRRESQNRASRNYRQRKKAYIKEMENKIEMLRMEVETLRTENQKNRRMLQQFHGDGTERSGGGVGGRPAPLIRSYSSELQDEEDEIEKLVEQLNERANNPTATEEDLRILLHALHEHMGKRQQLLNKEAMQLINPKLQERMARLEATPQQHQVDESIGHWLDQVSQFVSPEQIQKLAELKQTHMAARAAIWEERALINADIKQFYQEKVAAERLSVGPGSTRLDQNALAALTQKLEALKRNLLREDELNTVSVGEFSAILTPHQEAIITVKHYSHYKDKLSAIHMLNNVWTALSKQDKQ